MAQWKKIVTNADVGVTVQAYDAELAALAGLTSAADKGIQFTGSGAAAVYPLTTAGKALLDDANASAQRTTLGLGTAATRAAEDTMTDGANLPDGAAIKAYGDSNWGGDLTNFASLSDSGIGAGYTVATGAIILNFYGGEGMDVTNSAGTFTVAGEDATASNKGIAKFSTDNFTVSSGNVTIKDAGVILGTETTGNYVADLTGTANEVTVSGSTGSVTIGMPDDVTIGGVLTVTGNLVVNGATTTVSSENLEIQDKVILIGTDGAAGFGGAANSSTDTGIVFAGINTSTPRIDEGIKLLCVKDGFQFDTGDSRAMLKVTHIDDNTLAAANDTGAGVYAHMKMAALMLDPGQGNTIQDNTPGDGTIVFDGDDLYLYVA